MADDPRAGRVIVGRVSGIYGVQGWVRVYSHTAPRLGILAYSPWYLGHGADWQRYEVAEGRSQGKGIIARLGGITDRDQARALMGRHIAVARDQLPALAEDEHYWVDLIGLEVVTVEGRVLGTVAGLMETGANDVLVVKGERERLVPYLPGTVVRRVDRVDGRITVDWDADF